MNRYILHDLSSSCNDIPETYANIHLVWLHGDFNLPNLEKEYPNIAKQLKHGDLIENQKDAGYLTDGLYMCRNYFGNKEIIDLTYHPDAQFPNTCFRMFRDFVPSHWDYNHMMVINHQILYPAGQGPLSYWSDGDPVAILEMKYFPELRDPRRYSKFTFRLLGWMSQEIVTYYTHFSYNNRNFLVFTSKYNDKRLNDDIIFVTNHRLTRKNLLACPKYVKLLEKYNVPIENVVLFSDFY